MEAAARSRRRRWPLVVAAALVVAILFAAWQLQSENLAKTVLERAGAAFGLELTFDGTPSYSLSPEPQLELPVFAARQPGAATPLLTAKRLSVSLPWDTITGADATVITRIELDEPVLDLAALAAWQRTRPDEPFELPTLTRGLEVDGGTIVGAGWRLTGVDLSLPELKPGAAADADLAGRFERGTLAIEFAGDATMARPGRVTPLTVDLQGSLATGGDAAPLPWTLVLDGALDADDEPMRLADAAVRAGGTLPAGDRRADWSLATTLDATLADGVADLDLRSATFTGDPPLPELQFDGHVRVDDALHVALGGAMPRWPEGWPALPAPLSESRPMSFVIGYDGATDLTAPMRLRARRGDTRLDVRGVVPELLAWMERDDASPLPPIAGSLDTPAIVVGGFTLDGLHIEFDDDDPFANVDSSVDSTESPGGARGNAAGSPRSP